MPAKQVINFLALCVFFASVRTDIHFEFPTQSVLQHSIFELKGPISKFMSPAEETYSKGCTHLSLIAC